MLKNELPVGNESETETREELDRIFHELFQGIRRINYGSPEADQNAQDLLIGQAKRNLIPIFEPYGIEVIKIDEYGLVLAIPVAYTADRTESVVRLLISRGTPFGELQIKIQARIHCDPEEESDEDKYNWYVGEDCFTTLPHIMPTSDSLTTIEGRKKAIRIMEEFDIAKISNGRFYDDDLKSKVAPEDLIESLRMALYVFEKLIK